MPIKEQMRLQGNNQTLPSFMSLYRLPAEGMVQFFLPQDPNQRSRLEVDSPSSNPAGKPLTGVPSIFELQSILDIVKLTTKTSHRTYSLSPASLFLENPAIWTTFFSWPLGPWLLSSSTCLLSSSLSLLPSHDLVYSAGHDQSGPFQMSLSVFSLISTKNPTPQPYLRVVMASFSFKCQNPIMVLNHSSGAHFFHIKCVKVNVKTLIFPKYHLPILFLDRFCFALFFT